jgi:hypothetical protein
VEARRSYLRLLLEGVVIVGSILLAFAIQAWWDNSQEAEEALRLLISIQSENRQNIERIELHEDYRQLVSGYIRQLATLADNPEAADPNEVDRLIGDTLWYQTDALNWASLDALVDGGQVTLIEDATLRDQLTRLHRYQALFIEIYELEQKHVVDRMAPYLAANGQLAQVLNTTERFPGFPWDYPALDFPVAEKVDHRALFKQPEFQAIIAWKLTQMNDTGQENGRFLPEARRVDELLSAYIAQQ